MSELKWDLDRLDTGSRSALKRSAGCMLGTDLRSLEAFWRAANAVPRGREDIWYACMCLECLWKPEDHPKVLPFEEILRKMYQAADTSDSIRHRITSMMDIPWGPDGFLLGKLNGFVRMIKAGDSSMMPDFQKLADDLAGWNYPEHNVQRRWIRAICGWRKEETEKEEEAQNVD